MSHADIQRAEAFPGEGSALRQDQTWCVWATARELVWLEGREQGGQSGEGKQRRARRGRASQELCWPRTYCWWNRSRWKVLCKEVTWLAYMLTDSFWLICRECSQRDKREAGSYCPGKREKSREDEQTCCAQGLAGAPALAPALAPRGSSYPPHSLAKKRKTDAGSCLQEACLPSPLETCKPFSEAWGSHGNLGWAVCTVKGIRQCFPYPDLSRGSIISGEFLCQHKHGELAEIPLTVTLRGYRPDPGRDARAPVI